MNRELAAARAHVVAQSGSTQFALLVREGLTRNSRVLEFGCGMLDLARWLVPYLRRGDYLGVDPNSWVQLAALADPVLAEIMAAGDATFAEVDHFTVVGEFDFVFAHSVLSHAADYQLTQFLERPQLRPGGTILASLRLADRDSNDREWVYPDVSYFRKETIAERAHALGLRTHWRPEYRDLMVAEHPDEIHDWVAFTRIIDEF